MHMPHDAWTRIASMAHTLVPGAGHGYHFTQHPPEVWSRKNLLFWVSLTPSMAWMVSQHGLRTGLAPQLPETSRPGCGLLRRCRCQKRAQPKMRLHFPIQNTENVVIFKLLRIGIRWYERHWQPGYTLPGPLTCSRDGLSVQAYSAWFIRPK